MARACAIKELATRLWGLPLPGLGGPDVAALVRVGHSQSPLQPIKKVARTIKRHWDGVLDAVLTNVTNARSEATNAKIQWIKRLGCGYRNRERFRNAIYFHLGGSTSTRTPWAPTRNPEAPQMELAKWLMPIRR